jgi:REP element-mobilizing transposase RayT
MSFMARSTRQLVLDLRDPPGWGGPRAGAGRKAGSNPRDPHRARPPLAARFPCHATLKTRRGIPSLRHARFVRELEASLRAACERGRFRVVHYSIQRDHLHAIVEANGREDLADGMKALGARFARAVNRVFGLRGRVLADRYHLHILRTPREVRNAIAYVLLNARRHLMKRGGRLAAALRLDPASSARWFDGWRGGPVEWRGPDVPAVADPHTWLLRAGWRRRGLIDAWEVPGRGR